jgi:hypothetical protein
LVCMDKALTQGAAPMGDRNEKARRCRLCEASMRVDIYIAPCGNESGLIVYACPSCGAVDTMTTDETATLKWKTARSVQ